MKITAEMGGVVKLGTECHKFKTVSASTSKSIFKRIVKIPVL